MSKRSAFIIPSGIKAQRQWNRLRATSAYKATVRARTGSLRCQVPACGWQDTSSISGDFNLLTVHHVRRVADGGRHKAANFLILCPSCHSRADKLSRSNKNLTKGELIDQLNVMVKGN